MCKFDHNPKDLGGGRGREIGGGREGEGERNGRKFTCQTTTFPCQGKQRSRRRPTMLCINNPRTTFL